MASTSLTLPVSGGGDDTLINLIKDKYVRTTRFESIGSGTSGAVTLPANSEVVLDDFGGTVDAVVSQISSGYPTLQTAVNLDQEIIATTFDSSGNWSITDAPVSYPIAIIYRVRQKLSQFDSTSSNIVGDTDVENPPSGYNFGTGEDGDATISGSTTLTREMYYRNLTVTAAGNLNPGGYRIYVSGILTIDSGGVIQRNGNDGSPGVGTSGGSAGAAITNGEILITSGVIGAVGANGTSNANGSAGSVAATSTVSVGGFSTGSGGAGGNGSTGLTGGTTRTATTGTSRPALPTILNVNMVGNKTSGYGGHGGASGGGTASKAGSGGGGGGGGGAIVLMYVNTLNNSGSITANGGAGGSGVGSVDSGGNASGPGGGGGGGSGGYVGIIVNSIVSLGTITANGGAGGIAGAASGGATAGVNGGDGGIGFAKIYELRTNKWVVNGV